VEIAGFGVSVSAVHAKAHSTIVLFAFHQCAQAKGGVG
jgi:hypothetical protein